MTKQDDQDLGEGGKGTEPPTSVIPQDSSLKADPRDNGCLCQLCGERYKVDLWLPDELWERIQEFSPSGAEHICGPCLVRRIERIGQEDYFFLSRTPDESVEGLSSASPGSDSVVDERCICGIDNDPTGRLPRLDILCPKHDGVFPPAKTVEWQKELAGVATRNLAAAEAADGVAGLPPCPFCKASTLSVSSGWTKDKPTVDGWYWYRHNPEEYTDLPPEVTAPRMLMVYEGGTRCQDTVNDLFGSEIKASMGGLWSGPLVPPPLPR